MHWYVVCKTSDKNFASLDYFHISFALNIKFHKLCVLTLGSSELASSLSISKPSPGLSLQRQWYLCDNIYDFCWEDAKDILCPRPAGPKPTTTRDADTAASTLAAASTSAAAEASPTGVQQRSGRGRGRGRSATRTEPVRGQSRGRGRGAKRSVADDSKVDHDMGRGHTMGRKRGRGRRRIEWLHTVMQRML